MPPTEFQFHVVRDDRTLDECQSRYPLFFDACRPSLGEWPQHAVVADAENTFLLVLRHRSPFDRNPVDIRSVVVEHPSGIRRLTAFLRDYRRTMQPIRRRALGVRMDLQFQHFGPGVREDDVSEALQRELGFRPGKRPRGGKP